MLAPYLRGFRDETHLSISQRHRLFTAVLLSCAMACFGCGGSSKMISPTTQLEIILQPADVSSPLGMTATFTVKAEGSGSLVYQWQRDHSDIRGATNASYTTPPVAASDSGSLFTVMVSEGSDSVSSAAAKLMVGPRSPENGDLRFQQVGSAAIAETSNIEGVRTILWYPIKVTYPNSLGTPLRLGTGQCVPAVKQDCGWLYGTSALPGTPLNVAYEPDILENLDGDVRAVPATAVINSLDIESDEDVFAMSILGGAAAGFDGRHETTSLNALPAAIASDGAAGQVVTAISYNDASGNVDLLSYGWAVDTTTLYDTEVKIASYSNIGDAASAIAASGYIITAFGGNGTDGYILVGTKVRGDTLQRPILISPDATGSTQGYALVGWAINSNYQSDPDPPVWIYER
jgi:hypothetical protein